MATATPAKNTKAEASPINQEIKNLAQAIKADLKIDPKTGAATLPKNMYDRLLPEEVTREMAEQVAAANADIAAALALAVGETSIPLMKKEKGLDRVTVMMPATGRDRFEAVFDRTYSVAQMEKGADGKMVHTGREERYGNTRVAFNTFGTRNKGQMGAIKEHLAEQARKALAG